MTLTATMTLEERAADARGSRRRGGAGRGDGGARAGPARRGRALVDRAAFPRWKVCGCCLNGRAAAVIGRGRLKQLCGDPSSGSTEEHLPRIRRPVGRMCRCLTARPCRARLSTQLSSRRRLRPARRSCPKRCAILSKKDEKSREYDAPCRVLLQQGEKHTELLRESCWRRTGWPGSSWREPRPPRRPSLGAHRRGDDDDGRAGFLSARRGLHDVRRRRLHRPCTAGRRPVGHSGRLRRRRGARPAAPAPPRLVCSTKPGGPSRWVDGTSLARHTAAYEAGAAGRRRAAVRRRRRRRLRRAVHRRRHGLGAGVGDGRGAAGRRAAERWRPELVRQWADDSSPCRDADDKRFAERPPPCCADRGSRALTGARSRPSATVGGAGDCGP